MNEFSYLNGTCLEAAAEVPPYRQKFYVCGRPQNAAGYCGAGHDWSARHRALAAARSGIEQGGPT